MAEGGRVSLRTFSRRTDQRIKIDPVFRVTAPAPIRGGFRVRTFASQTTQTMHEGAFVVKRASDGLSSPALIDAFFTITQLYPGAP